MVLPDERWACWTRWWKPVGRGGKTPLRRLQRTVEAIM
jgi:hypothetical protein